MGVMLVPADMSPTVLELSMLPRGLLMPSLRLMLSMVLTDMASPTPMVPTILDTDILDTPTPMVLTTDMLDTLTPPLPPPPPSLPMPPTPMALMPSPPPPLRSAP